MIVRTTDIKPHPKNSEIYDLSNIDDLVESIKEVGLLQPIIINNHNQILSGHRRFESIKRLGWEEVEVEIKDVKDDEVDLFLVHFNKQRIKSNKEILVEYDILENHFDNKQGLRTDLTSVSRNISYSKRDEISSKIGVSSSSLGRLLFIRKHNSELIKMIDRGVLTIRQSYLQTQREVNEKESRRKVEKSDVKINNWRFYQKSSHQMDELKDGEVQTIFTSPPYWNKRLYAEGGGLGNEKTSEEFVVNISKH